MEFLKVFIPMLIVVIVVVVGYNLLKLYVLDSLRVNKWIVLAVAVVVMFAPNIILGEPLRGVLQYIQTALFLFAFLWFLDLIGFSGRGKRRVDKNVVQKSNVIRAKAKPNRIKNNDIEVIKTEDNKKKKKK